MTQSKYAAKIIKSDSDKYFAERIFRFRHDLFVGELGWSLPGVKGSERDAFDSPDATYCALMSGNQIVGCFRAIPCDRPYLAREVFPYMAKHRPYPTTNEFIEVSRLGVLASYRRASPLLYSLMLRYGVASGAKGLVALADLAHERHLNRMRLHTVRYGSAQIVGFREDGGWLLAVAGEIPIPDPLTPDMKKLLSLTKNMDIDDEAHVLRREGLSA